MRNLNLKPSEYLELKEGFSGGFTHANRKKAAMIQQQVGSYDFTSSYPASMVAFKYPMSTGKYVGDTTYEEIYELSKKYCCLFRMSGDNIISLNWNEHPLSSSKCRNLVEALRDNGRLVTARHFETTCTEQDLFTYKLFYEWENPKYFDLIIYEKNYLPTPLVKAILELYNKKTTLKGIAEELVNYMISKGMLNAAYGMMVTDIVREILDYDGESYHSNFDNMTTEEYNAFLEKQIERYNNNPYRFLFYPWGVWVTAYSRANLFSGIRACGNDYIYSDTDSIKILNPDKHKDYIERYNRDITERLKEACAFHGIDFQLTRPKSKDGTEHPLGIWDFEGVYDEFMTLGAKRYMWRKGDHYEITVAGVNKTMGRDYIVKKAKELKVSPFELFNESLVIPREYSGRNVLTYIDDHVEGDITDYLGETYHFSEESAIHMESTEYSFDQIKSFLNYLITIREEQW